MNVAGIVFSDELTRDRQHNWVCVEGDVCEGTCISGRGGFLGDF
jgi:hypothetical protein